MHKMVLIPYDRYQRLLASKEPKSVSTMDEEPTIVDQNALPDVSEQRTESEKIDKVVSYFPKGLRTRARSLLSYIVPRVTWNEKGEVVVDGNIIVNSNIVDLVKVQLNDYKHFRPTGLDIFTDIIKDSNVPLSLLASSQRVQTLPPPPGSPVKREKVQRKAQKVKWLRL